jgi:hypothetical protein
MQEAPQADVSAADEFVQGQRVCVVVYGDRAGGSLENTTHMVMLDNRGYPVDLLQLPQFSGHIPASKATLESIKEDTRKSQDVEKIIKFLSKHWPHLIVIGACSPECKQLLDDILKICNVDISQVRPAARSALIVTDPPCLLRSLYYAKLGKCSQQRLVQQSNKASYPSVAGAVLPRSWSTRRQ